MLLEMTCIITQKKNGQMWLIYIMSILTMIDLKYFKNMKPKK